MSEQYDPGAEHLPPPVLTLPDTKAGKKWYRTLDEAIHAWAVENDLHKEQELPQIRVYLHSHIGGWNVG